jgi:uncharacterized protein YjbI with pentapeptide repeats
METPTPSLPSYPQSLEELAAYLQKGRPVSFPLEAPRDKRQIPSDWFSKLLFPGYSRTCSVPVNISGAIFIGKLVLTYATVQFEFSIRDSEFGDGLTLSSVRFQRSANFTRCEIKVGASLRGCQFEYSCVMSGSQFSGADFSDVTFGGSAIFEPSGLASVSTAVPKVTRFAGQTNFDGAKFVSTANFGGVVFEGETTFRRVRFASNARFRAWAAGPNNAALATVIKGPADFSDCDIQGNADFSGAQFESGLRAQRLRVGAATFFSTVQINNLTCNLCCNGEVNFDDALFHGSAWFLGAIFTGNVSFRRARFESTAGFDVFEHESVVWPTCFGGKTIFNDASVSGPMSFEGAIFTDEVRFERISVGSNAHFRLFRGKERAVPICFGARATFLLADIQGAADFNGAWFGSDLVFQGAKLAGRAHFESVVHLEDVVVPFECMGEARFISTSAGSVFFHGAHFHGRALFSGFKAVADAMFSPLLIWGNPGDSAPIDLLNTRFDGLVSFKDAQIGGTADFSAATFRADAEFVRIRVGGGAFFQTRASRTGTERTVFKGRADFTNAQFEGAARFTGVSFKKACVFEAASFKDIAAFDVSRAGNKATEATFGGFTNFKLVRVERALFVNGALFLDAAQFDSMQVEGEASFSAVEVEFYNNERPSLFEFRPTRFAGRATFDDAKVLGSAFFLGVQFEKGASFQRTQIIGLANFSTFEGKTCAAFTWFHNKVRFNLSQLGHADFVRTRFVADASFVLVRVAGRADFRWSLFGGVASLTEARFELVQFTSERLPHDLPSDHARFNTRRVGIGLEQPFEPGKWVDLRGFSYARIDVFWPYVFHLMAYDRQPYTHLERFYRSVGKDWEANQIYLEGRHEERRLLWDRAASKSATWGERWATFQDYVFDGIQGLLFHYGVPFYPLLYVTLVVFGLGVFLLGRPGALVEKAPAFRISVESHALSLNWPRPPGSPSFFEPLKVSLNLVAPTERMAPETSWKPADKGEGWIATLVLKVTAFLLFPLSLASISGLFKRKESS